MVRPSHLEDAQQLALRLLSQALDAATLLSASALAPHAADADAAKAPVEIFAKYVTLAEGIGRSFPIQWLDVVRRELRS